MKQKVMLKIILLQIFILAAGLTGYSLDRKPVVKNFLKNEYKAASQNWSVSVGKDGCIYFGNSMGLLEFDGVVWDLYPSAKGEIIRTVAVGNDNRIFTGGYREIGYWERDSVSQLSYRSLTDKVEQFFTSDEEFWNIMLFKDAICFQSFSGVYIYEADSFRVIKPGGFVNFATVTNDELFLMLHGNGIYQWDHDKLNPFLVNDFTKKTTINFLAKVPHKNEYVVGTESDGLYLYQSVIGELSPWAVSLSPAFKQSKINRGLMLPDGNIVFGTILDGVIGIDQAGYKSFHFNKEADIPSNTVLGITCDQNGDLWFALDRGITRIIFPDDSFLRFTHAEEIGALYTAAIFEDDLYLGTNQGLYRGKLNDQDSDYSLVPNTQEQVWECKIIDNYLFVGHNSGTFTIKNGQLKKISDYSGGYSLIQNPSNHNQLVQCTYTSLVVYEKKNGNWNLLHQVKGFNNLIRFIEFDHIGNLWASHLYHGIYKLKLSDKLDTVLSVFHYGTNNKSGIDFRNTNVFKIGGRIVFTTGDNIYTYDDLNDSIIAYTSLNNGLEEFSTATRIVDAGNNYYWLICKSGIGYFRIYHDQVERLKVYPATLFKNLMIPKNENIIPLDENIALVCLENGYTILDNTLIKPDVRITDHQLQLREIIISGKKNIQQKLAAENGMVTIPFSKNNLLLRYAFPFDVDNRYTFRYQIEGLTDTWSETYDKPIFNITRIPPGEYVVKVVAENFWQNKSKVHELKINITQPWYQSIPVIISYAIVFMVIIFIIELVVIFQVKQREKHKREEKERELIQLRNEKLRSELSFKSQQLANSTMGLIKKNEFLLSLKKRLSRQKEHLGVRYPDKYYADIIDSIDENISGVDDWKVFESNFEQSHETFLKNIKKFHPDLTSGDMRLCAYLRINLTSKEIAPLLGISVRGVENHRYRLRKKLNLQGDSNLIDYILRL